MALPGWLVCGRRDDLEWICEDDAGRLFEEMPGEAWLQPSYVPHSDRGEDPLSLYSVTAREVCGPADAALVFADHPSRLREECIVRALRDEAYRPAGIVVLGDCGWFEAPESGPWADLPIKRLENARDLKGLMDLALKKERR